jgi:hypothetical protein
MTECERCGEECKRRRLCFHCGHYVCSYCWHHECECMPGHRPENCMHLNAMKRVGRVRYLQTVIASHRAKAGLPPLKIVGGQAHV